jgi:hypothetical protein
VTAAPPRPKPVVSPAARFRKEIETALAGGAEPAGLLLHLTLSDASRLLRDHDTPAEDIRFASGEMWFRGVQVQKGAESSTLVVVPSASAEP